MTRSATECSILEPAMPPCPAWRREKHEPVRLENELDGAIVDHVIPVGELTVRDYCAGPEETLMTISVRVVATDFFNARGHWSDPPMVHLDADTPSLDLLKLNGQHTREYGQMVERAAQTLNWVIQCGDEDANLAALSAEAAWLRAGCPDPEQRHVRMVREFAAVNGGPATVEDYARFLETLGMSAEEARREGESIAEATRALLARHADADGQ